MGKLTREAVEKRVREIIVEQLGVNADEVTQDADLVDDLGADSLDAVELVMAAEEEFCVEIDIESTTVKTVCQLVDIIWNKIP